MNKFVLLAVILFLFSGCVSLTPKIIKVPQKTYSNALVYANGCGKNLEEAKENAKVNLSANIVSMVDSKWESNSERNDSSYNSTAKKSANIKSSFLILFPKFDNHFIQKELFKPDIHCIDILLDNSSLKKYENIANSIYNEIYKVIMTKNMNIKYKQKEIFARNIISFYKDKIEQYNNIANFINYLSNKNVRDVFTIESIKSMLNSYPYADFKIEGELSYGKEIKFIPLVNDEDIKSLQYRWSVNGQIYHMAYLKLKFDIPAIYQVSLIVCDSSNLKTQVSRSISITNKNPIANFNISPQKEIYFVGEKINFYNSSVDDDRDIISYRWNFSSGFSSDKKNLSTFFNNIGKHTINFEVIDKFNTKSSSQKSIRVESNIYKNSQIGMTSDEVLQKLGFPERDINLNITSKLNSFINLNEKLIENIGLESEKAYLYGDYWLVLRGKILQCLIYKQYFEKQNCQWFNQNKPYAIAKQ